ncbi:MAG: hypothetical protein FWG43_05755 [Clostridiales bacterium]|nr:hypothetical protein [Clostridiales bacterium]
MLIENREKMMLALAEAAPSGRISCENARLLAEDLNLPYDTVGEAANELGVKVYGCQLGCYE